MDLKDRVKQGIKSYMSPTRIALLLGIPELELKTMIIDDSKFLQEVRDLLFDMQIGLSNTAVEMIEKKQPTDFLFQNADNHFELWSRFIATDLEKSSDYVLLSSAIQGGIGNNQDFWKGASSDLKESFKVALRTNENFLRMFFSAVEGVNFTLGKHHRAMFEELVRLERGLTNILIINLPPRVGKSTTLYAWATKQLMQKKGSNIIYGSYGEVVLTLIRKRIDMAFSKSKYDDNKINPFYEIYQVAKAKGFDKEADFLTDINSSFFSATLMGGITGRGYSVYADANGAMLIDDPNNPNDVGTARMDTIWEKFLTTWNSRRGLNPLCVNMQRVADNDFTANTLEQYKDSDLTIRVLTLPLEMTEEVEAYVAKMQAKYPKITFISPLKYMEMGDTLLPSKDVELIKQSMHPSIYKTQYLQIPTALEGSIFKSRMFYNKVLGIEPVLNSRGMPIGFVNVKALKRDIENDVWNETHISFEGVFILHIDTTSGNTDSVSKDVDDCVWSVCVGGIKSRKANDNGFGAVLYQYGISSKEASDVVMQQKSLDILKEMWNIYNAGLDDNKKMYPKVIIAIEAHSQGGGLASYLRGQNLPNIMVISYSRQNFGNKKQRFVQGSGFYEDRIFWWQEDNNLLEIEDFTTKKMLGVNDWYYASRMQHLGCDGERGNIHDDYIEAPIDLCNLWLANDGKDKIFQEFYKDQTKGGK